MICNRRGAAADACKSGLETSSEGALQAMVYGVSRFRSVDELMLFNALALHRRQLLRLQQDDDWTELLQVIFPRIPPSRADELPALAEQRFFCLQSACNLVMLCIRLVAWREHRCCACSSML